MLSDTDSNSLRLQVARTIGQNFKSQLPQKIVLQQLTAVSQLPAAEIDRTSSKTFDKDESWTDQSV